MIENFISKTKVALLCRYSTCNNKNKNAKTQLGGFASHSQLVTCVMRMCIGFAGLCGEVANWHSDDALTEHWGKARYCTFHPMYNKRDARFSEYGRSNNPDGVKMLTSQTKQAADWLVTESCIIFNHIGEGGFWGGAPEF